MKVCKTIPLMFALGFGLSLPACNNSSGDQQKFAPSKNTGDVELLDEEGEENANKKLVEEFLDLVTQISQRHKALERERDRRGKLQLELLGLGGNDSCMLEMPVEKIEFFIDGQKLPDLDVSEQLGKRKGLKAPSVDEPQVVTFEYILGNSQKRMVFSHDEASYEERLFVKGRNKVFPPEEGYRLKDLQFVKIRKPNHFHTTEYVCQGKTVQACNDEFQGNPYRVIENFRYKLRKFKIRVNNELVYQNDILDFGFVNHKKGSEEIRNHGLEWHDPNIMLNEAFVKLMQVEQCSF